MADLGSHSASPHARRATPLLACATATQALRNAGPRSLRGMSRCTSTRASSWRWSGRAAAARRRCSRLFAGLEAPTSGDDRACMATRMRRGSGTSGYMPQRDLLLPWRTALDNAVAGLEVAGVSRGRGARARAQRSSPQFGLAGFERAWPATLSGGMRQRVAFARTVLAGTICCCWTSRSARWMRSPAPSLQRWLAEMWGRLGADLPARHPRSRRGAAAGRPRLRAHAAPWARPAGAARAAAAPAPPGDARPPRDRHAEGRVAAPRCLGEPGRSAGSMTLRARNSASVQPAHTAVADSRGKSSASRKLEELAQVG